MMSSIGSLLKCKEEGKCPVQDKCYLFFYERFPHLINVTRKRKKINKVIIDRFSSIVRDGGFDTSEENMYECLDRAIIEIKEYNSIVLNIGADKLEGLYSCGDLYHGDSSSKKIVINISIIGMTAIFSIMAASRFSWLGDNINTIIALIPLFMTLLMYKYNK